MRRATTREPPQRGKRKLAGPQARPIAALARYGQQRRRTHSKRASDQQPTPRTRNLSAPVAEKNTRRTRERRPLGAKSNECLLARIPTRQQRQDNDDRGRQTKQGVQHQQGSLLLSPQQTRRLAHHRMRTRTLRCAMTPVVSEVARATILDLAPGLSASSSPAPDVSRRRLVPTSGTHDPAAVDADVPGKHKTPGNPRVLRDGRYWARTSDLRLVEAALSQLS